jgi:hypothetical protein
MYDGTAWEAACLKTGEERQKYVVELTEPSATWLKKSGSYAILPPGEYYIGDVRAGLPSELRTVMTSGLYTNGLHVYMGTICPGTLLGSDRLYDVSSGYIGIRSATLCANTDGLALQVFTGPVSVRMKPGFMTVQADGFMFRGTVMMDA